MRVTLALVLAFVVPSHAFAPRGMASSVSSADRRSSLAAALSTNDARSARRCERGSALRMVRNIDLVEALVFYGDDSLYCPMDAASGDSRSCEFLPGVRYLLDECERDETEVLYITTFYEHDNDDDDDGATARFRRTLSDTAAEAGMTVRTAQRPPPNPRDLYEALQSITVQPKGFGGSSGFGTKLADPERPPAPKHTVVLCSTVDQCRAARFVGTRVLCLNDNDLADGVVDLDWSTICMDDIATPGSFWLNPPQPRDDESNRVDPESVMEYYERDVVADGSGGSISSTAPDSTGVVQDEMSDDELRSILADMDSL